MSKKNNATSETSKKPIPASPEPSHGVAPMWTDWPEGVEPEDETDETDETDESDESTDAAE